MNKSEIRDHIKYHFQREFAETPGNDVVQAIYDELKKVLSTENIADNLNEEIRRNVIKYEFLRWREHFNLHIEETSITKAVDEYLRRVKQQPELSSPNGKRYFLRWYCMEVAIKPQRINLEESATDTEKQAFLEKIYISEATKSYLQMAMGLRFEDDLSERAYNLLTECFLENHAPNVARDDDQMQSFCDNHLELLQRIKAQYHAIYASQATPDHVAFALEALRYEAKKSKVADLSTLSDEEVKTTIDNIAIQFKCFDNFKNTLETNRIRLGQPMSFGCIDGFSELIVSNIEAAQGLRKRLQTLAEYDSAQSAYMAIPGAPLREGDTAIVEDRKRSIDHNLSCLL